MNDDAPDDLNLTPYLDVLMNLILFVLVSGAGLLTWGVLPARAGGAGGGEAGPVPRVRLEKHAMTLRVGEEPALPVTLDELPHRLSGVRGRRLVLEAEADVTLEQVVSAMDAARKAHFDEVTLAD